MLRLGNQTKKKVLFCSRGRGYGHALPDMAIAEQLRHIDPSVEIIFVSYGSGAVALRQEHQQVVDLDLPEDNPLWETAVAIGKFLLTTRADLIVSHEEFAVGPVAKMLDIPSIFITEWFTSAADMRMRALAFYDEIILIEDKDIFSVPPYLADKIYETGPIIRKLRYGRQDRIRLRSRLGIPSDCFLITVFQGGWATERRQPIIDLVATAFDMLPHENKHLFWMAADDVTLVATCLRGIPNVSVFGYCRDIDLIMAASDVAITKANRITVRELSSLGIPSISLSNGTNRIDDVLIARCHLNTLCNVESTTASDLAEAIKSSHSSRSSQGASQMIADLGPGAIDKVAERLFWALNRNRPSARRDRPTRRHSVLL